MNEKRDEGDFAFPIPELRVAGGMTLRDWFAGQALAGILAKRPLEERKELTASVAYGFADAMIEARKK